jgi:uncharacterized cupin superfamily protein
MLECGMEVGNEIKIGIGKVELNSSPIYPGWILEGNPIARNALLSSSADGTASSYFWDCTAGRFNWFYEADESIYVIEGGVVIKDMAGISHRLSAGDTIFFPAGTHAEWTVETYIRKFALIRNPLPTPLVFARRGFRLFKRLIGAGAKQADAGMSPSAKKSQL